MQEVSAVTVVLDYDLITSIYYVVVFALGFIGGILVGNGLSWWKW